MSSWFIGLRVNVILTLKQVALYTQATQGASYSQKIHTVLLTAEDIS